MNTTINILAVVSTALYAVTSIVGLVRLHYQNKVLKFKLRRALTDCRAFYEIESRLCDSIADGAYGWQRPISLLGVKRATRAALREDGFDSPSEEATPKRIDEELAQL